MKVRLIDVNVAMGYADKLTPAQQKMAELHPELRVLPTEDAQRDPPFGFRYYPPTKYAVGEENRQSSWQELTQDHMKLASLLEQYPFYRDYDDEIQDTVYMDLLDLGIEVHVRKSRTVEVMPPAFEPDQKNLVFMENLIALNEKVIGQLSKTSSLMFNTATKSRQPGEGLMAINELMLCEDVCTDLMQKYLDKGWRILAICPQPDARRPDYIMGRVAQAETPKFGDAKRHDDV